MSSILTNTSAMIALQTMKGINTNLEKVQSEISTGKDVATARDNAAVWAISKVMESDVEAFQGISDSLALGSSTVGVARQAAETVTDLLTEIKGKIVSAQGENVDRVKIQADIDALTGQIGSVVSAAQFNGLNLVNGSTTSIDVLASLDRDGATTSASSITVTSQDLSFGTYTANDVFSTSGAATVSANSDTFVMSLDNGGGSDEITIQDGATAWAAGDKISMMIGDQTVSYTVSASDVDSGANTIADLVAVGLKGAIDELGIDGLTVDYDSANAGTLVFTNDGTSDLSVSGQFTNTGAGGLGALSQIDVTTNTTDALTRIESMLQTSVDAAAAFGSVQTRIDIQADFVGQLTDTLKTGIGSMVDADMEEASARLQALQTQQQLGIQALSIANQAPQSILSLFR
ncbi:MAG: flagellin [Rhodobacteraceae bacterium GWE1_64_9]|nr:MAG: flagellin [Rhodobacteraceae bacterium GWE1_64_9]OHC50930.1 MAG: flagellin [Rhodobacteraceae bacterium GWF1_65_7]HBD90477.1 flagellin [Gemmobacter sp.]HBU15347.1 flagellin [Gemmobacter sp.]